MLVSPTQQCGESSIVRCTSHYGQHCTQSACWLHCMFSSTPSTPTHTHTHIYIHTHTHTYTQGPTLTHTDTGVLSDARSTVVDSLVIFISILTIILCAISLIKSYLLSKVSIYIVVNTTLFLSIVLCPSLGCEELLCQTL